MSDKMEFPSLGLSTQGYTSRYSLRSFSVFTCKTQILSFRIDCRKPLLHFLFCPSFTNLLLSLEGWHLSTISAP